MSNATITNSRRQVIALCPIYLAGAGDATLVYTRDGGRFTENRSIRSVLKQYVQLWSLDLAALRRNYSDAAKSTLSVPLPLEVGHTLVPVKMRKPICRSDLAYGYVELESVTGTATSASGANDEGRTIIHMGATAIPIAASPRHLRQCLERGHRVAESYRKTAQGTAIDLGEQRQLLIELLKNQSRLSEVLMNLKT
jgi:hypothetical protein